MRTRIIHLINPKTDSLTTRPIYLNRALYSPLAGLLAVAASIPRDRYEVVLTDENIETIDFDLKADLVGISAMTSYVNRGYEIADQFRSQGTPVVMGGVHPSFMPQEALRHCDAVVIGEVELVIDRLLDDLEQGSMRGTYRAEKLHPMAGMPMPRYDLLKKHRYVNRTFVQTSRGCHHGCTFCAEPLMNGLKFRYRPVDEVIHEIENCGARTISINDADFFGTPERPKEVMRALHDSAPTPVWQTASRRPPSSPVITGSAPLFTTRASRSFATKSLLSSGRAKVTAAIGRFISRCSACSSSRGCRWPVPRA